MKVSNFFARFIYFTYYFFMALLLLYSFMSPVMLHYVDILIGLIIFCPIGFFMIRKGALLLEKLNTRRCFFILLGTCFVIKLAWVLVFRILPEIDYKMYFDTAAALSRSYEIDSRYVALFPHIMGYSMFLSLFFELFGVHYFLPPLLNVLLSTVSLAALYHICLRLESRKTAIIASLLWICFPSQNVWNMLALSEPLYSTILLLIWLVIIKVNERFPALSINKVVLISLVLAFLLALFNMTRPLAVIPLLSLLIWLLLIDRPPVRTGKSIMRKAAYILTVLLCFTAFSVLSTRYTASRIGEKPASIPGYNIYVGFNADSEGAWNEGDSELLRHYNTLDGWSADRAQKQMLQEAIARIKNNGIDFPQLMFHKYLTFLGDDSGAVYNARTALKYTEQLSTTSNIFYFFMIAFSLYGAAFAMKAKNKSPLIIVCLYAIGLIMAQMLVEVANRYHYSVTLPVLILAAYGISKINIQTKALQT
jgi:hypothetical protein